MPKIGTVLTIIVGSFCIYCSQSALHEYDSLDASTHDASFVKEAAADPGACCSLPARKVVVDQEIQPIRDQDSCVTPEWDIGPYQRVVVQGDSLYSTFIEQKHGIAGFAYSYHTNGSENSVQIDPFNGTALRLRLSRTSTGTCRSVKLTVVGLGG